MSDQFFGPGFTDITARLPAYRLLILVAVLAAVLFIVNIFRPGWSLALVAVGSWLVVAIAAAAIYPAIIQRLQVNPQPQAREGPYIEHSIQFTREAWGLDEVEVRGFPAADDLEVADIEANQLTIDNLRIWDPSVSASHLSELSGASQLLHAVGGRHGSIPQPGHPHPGHAGGARARGSESAP